MRAALGYAGYKTTQLYHYDEYNDYWDANWEYHADWFANWKCHDDRKYKRFYNFQVCR
jgi:hypothetical protein